MARDMTLFVDDDGRAYHVYSSEENSTLHISELTDDYLAHSGRYARFFVGRFMEAPALFKRGGRYYLMMSGCTGWAPNAARSAVAESVWGPWRELGNPCEGPGARDHLRFAEHLRRRRGGHRPLYLHGRPLEPGRRRRRTLRVAARTVRRRGIPRRMARPLALGRVTECKTNLPHMKQTYQPKKR